MMSTEHDFMTSSKQWTSLVNYFEAVDRSRTPWLIFSGHRSDLEPVTGIYILIPCMLLFCRPMYIDSTNSEGSASDESVADLLMNYIEPLLMVSIQ